MAKSLSFDNDTFSCNGIEFSLVPTETGASFIEAELGSTDRIYKSDLLGFGSMSREYYLFILDRSGEYTLHFAEDHNLQNGMSFSTYEELETLLKKYHNSLPVRKAAHILTSFHVAKDLERNYEFANYYKWDTTERYYITMAPEIRGAENSMVLNNYVYSYPLRMATAIWNSGNTDDDVIMSIYQTPYSQSQILFIFMQCVPIGSAGGPIHPLFVHLNYPGEERPLDLELAVKGFEFPLSSKNDLVGLSKMQTPNQPLYDALCTLFDNLGDSFVESIKNLRLELMKEGETTEEGTNAEVTEEGTDVEITEECTDVEDTEEGTNVEETDSN